MYRKIAVVMDARRRKPCNTCKTIAATEYKERRDSVGKVLYQDLGKESQTKSRGEQAHFRWCPPEQRLSTLLRS